MNEFAQLVQDDCQVLLQRALLGKIVSFFGEDGCGKHGKDYFAHRSEISDVSVLIKTFSDENDKIEAVAIISLNNYSAKNSGLILTDVNFKLSLNNLLRVELISANSLSWGKVDEQGEDSVMMSIDVAELLEW